MNNSDFRQMVFQAGSLYERIFASERLSENERLFRLFKKLNDRPQPASSLETRQQGETFLQRWCETAAQGNWEKFEKRLAWDGLDCEIVRAALAASFIPAAPLSAANDSAEICFPDLPSWAETLKAIIQAALEWGGDRHVAGFLDAASPLDTEKPLPFEDILLPVLQVARQKLRTQLKQTEEPGLKLLSEAAYISLERQFLKQIIALCSQTLDAEFSRFRPLGQTLLSQLVAAQAPSSTAYYCAFVEKLLSDGLFTLFQTYPVLGRLVATTVECWVSAIADFLHHLNADLAELQHRFAESAPFGKVTQLDTSLSDAHHQMRSVIALTFDSGLKLIYKPRDLGLEVAYQQLLNWCNTKNVFLPFRVLRVLNRNTNRNAYGWVEYVEQLPCQDEAAAQRFYRRSGMLLCVLYVLRATDCHYGNLIANGEHPILVDMEALMHPDADPLFESQDSIDFKQASTQQFWNSVLRTGLLPQWEVNKQNRVAFDISGLGCVHPQEAPQPRLRWQAINTDNMRLAYEAVTVPPAANVAVLNQTPLSPNDYLPELIEGFEQMYCFFLQHRDSLLANDSPLMNLKQQRVRFIFRSTHIYDAIKQKSLSPQFLRSGVDRSIQLDVLSRAFLLSPTQPTAWEILHAERQALEQLDIPHFEVIAEEVALRSGSRRIVEQYLQHSGFSEVVAQLQQLNEADLQRQITLIRGSLCARVARVPTRNRDFVSQLSNRLSSDAMPQIDRTPIVPPTSDLFLCEAEAIAAEIEQSALLEPDGSANWIALTYLPEVERFQFRPLGDTLYDGRCGIALFLAALDSIRDRSQYRALALGALQSMRSWLHHPDPQVAHQVAKSLGIGGATGLGSVIYALVRISQFLQEPTLLEDAHRVAQSITPDLIAADRQLDLLGGAAGAILGLLTFYEATGDSGVLATAESCGQHLLKHRISLNGAPQAWKTIGDLPLTGFSHGAAGIAYALLRLYQVTQNSSYSEAAKEGMSYERRYFSAEAGNWADLRSHRNSNLQNRPSSYMVSWCHGAPGIGLARMGSLPLLETELERHEARQEIHQALQTTMRHLQTVDHLCCGNLGRTETLLMAAQIDAQADSQRDTQFNLQTTNQSKWKDIAEQQAAWTIAKAKQAGGYQLLIDLPTQFNPGFFQGTAGIGYQLLRLANPSALPAILLWE